MAFAFGNPVSDERMIMILQRKHLPCHQEIKHALQLGDVIMAMVAELEVALELCREHERLHSTSFSI